MVIFTNQNQIKIVYVLGKKYKFLYLNLSKIYIIINNLKTSHILVCRGRK